jgi:hypothetical protein
VRASVFKAYVGAYWQQCSVNSDRHDVGNIRGPYPNPITALRSWLDAIIQPEVLQFQEADDLAEKMRGIGLGGTLALLNQKASQRKPPAQLEWEESEDGKPHQRTFNATLRCKPHDVSST